MTEPTPAELRELQGRAEALLADLEAVHGRLLAADEPLRDTRFALTGGKDGLREAVDSFSRCAGEIARVRTARDPRLCKAHWGICPTCGPTLRSSGGETWCEQCGTRWDYDRLGSPCLEVAEFIGEDPGGGRVLLCGAHGRQLEKQVTNGRLIPLGEEE
ncbi:hypothetical protein ACGF07_32020 [Kitasatospora sp. NPDC048194]|uniref:hypothetical protein n=1 Tax=Kitasatospora sp. NPDC048194 TaxID=3364045 RepID=UPI003715F525